MLLCLVLFTRLQSLQCTPLPPLHAYSVNSTINIGPGGCPLPVAPDDGGQQLRSAFSILQSCFLTIFTCVWTSAHPNINGPRDSWWTCAKRKVISTVYAVIAPEAIFLWAVSQRQAAKTTAEKYNKAFAELNVEEAKMEKPLWKNITALFLPLHPHTTWRGDGQSWSITHGYFIQMGGFILYENGYPTEVLDYNRLKDLLLSNAINAPTVTERELQDRSKGDTVSKTIVVLQTTWFVIQCIARAGQHLPLSELEVLTLAFAVVNAAIYGAWWNKPQGVDTAICVPLKTPQIEDNTPEIPMKDEVVQVLSHPQTYTLPHTEPCDSPTGLPHEQQSDGIMGEQHSWLRRTLLEDYAQYNNPYFLFVRLPYRILGFFLHPFDKMGDPPQFEPKSLRVPMFYGSAVTDSMLIGKAASIFGVVFGAIHLIAWESHFPSPRDRLLWRVSAVTMTMAPLLALVSLVTWKKIEVAASTRTAFLALLIPLYVASRVISIAIALKAIHNPPNNVLLDISWTTYIPHF